MPGGECANLCISAQDVVHMLNILFSGSFKIERCYNVQDPADVYT